MFGVYSSIPIGPFRDPPTDYKDTVDSVFVNCEGQSTVTDSIRSDGIYYTTLPLSSSTPTQSPLFISKCLGVNFFLNSDSFMESLKEYRMKGSILGSPFSRLLFYKTTGNKHHPTSISPEPLNIERETACHVVNILNREVCIK